MQVKSQLLDIKGMVARKKLEHPVYEIKKIQSVEV